MPYKPTGNPPGRPKNPEAPARPAKTAFKEVNKNVKQASPAEHRPFELAPICTECWPEGWPKGWTGIGCPHGIWARRL